MQNQNSNNKITLQSTNSKVSKATKQELTDKVFTSLQKQKNNGLVLPKNYNVANALNFAYLKLSQSGLLNTENQASLANALLDMCVQGLNPAKNQCYFIEYNKKVTMMRSYFGDRAACIQSGLVKDIQANVIYEGDEVNTYYNDGYLIVGHKTDFKNMNNSIIGAYAFAVLPDGKKLYDIMPIERIKKSWAMSKNQSNNKLQQSFTDDACKRTVIRHLVKNIFQQSIDDNVVVDSFVQSTDNEYDFSQDAESATKEIQEKQEQEMATVKINANTGEAIEHAYQEDNSDEPIEHEEFVEPNEFDNYDI